VASKFWTPEEKESRNEKRIQKLKENPEIKKRIQKLKKEPRIKKKKIQK